MKQTVLIFGENKLTFDQPLIPIDEGKKKGNHALQYQKKIQDNNKFLLHFLNNR